MSKVYIINDSGHDFTDAERFGETITLSYGKVSPFQTTEMMRKLVPALIDSSPDDFIVSSGPTIMFTVACCLFTMMHGRLNLLIYNGRHYKPRKINFETVDKWKEHHD